MEALVLILIGIDLNLINFIRFLLLILFSSNALASNDDKLNVTTIIIIFIIAQILSIIGIVCLGLKKKKREKNLDEN